MRLPWISAKSADKVVASQLEKLPEGKRLRVEDFKGDRWVEVLKSSVNNYRIEECGFTTGSYDIDGNELKSTLKRLFEAEFPRSHQLRVSIGENNRSKQQPESNSSRPSLTRHRIGTLDGLTSSLAM